MNQSTPRVLVVKDLIPYDLSEDHYGPTLPRIPLFLPKVKDILFEYFCRKSLTQLLVSKFLHMDTTNI